MIMVAEKSHNLQLASWRPKRADGIVQVQDQVLRTRRTDGVSYNLRTKSADGVDLNPSAGED